MIIEARSALADDAEGRRSQSETSPRSRFGVCARRAFFTTQRNEERSAAKPQFNRSREDGGHNMILPDNDFARNGSGKMICGQNDSEFVRTLTVWSAKITTLVSLCSSVV
jgi:hypothetical protein